MTDPSGDDDTTDERSNEPSNEPDDEVRPAWDGFSWHLAQAQALAHGGTELPGDARLRGLRQGIIRRTAPSTAYQIDFNRHVTAALQDLSTDLVRRTEETEHGLWVARQERQQLHEHLATLEGQHRDTVTRLERLADELAKTTEQLAARLDEAHSEIAQLRGQQELVYRTARQALEQHGLDPQQLSDLAEQLDLGDDRLYNALERTFRGTRDEIEACLAEYRPDVEAVGGPVVDVGTGRGEWLELLQEWGVKAYGVDTNERFVDDNRERGFDVRHQDALVHLREIPEASLGVVTAFHLAEHLPFDTLLELLDAAHRALRPGGLFIAESPNPRTVSVGAANFWIDPTHARPLHPELFEFLAQERGFNPTKLRYLRPHPRYDVALPAGITDTPANREVWQEVRERLFGAQDFALLATRPSDAS